MSFFFSFLSFSVFLQIEIERERERVYKIGYKEKQSQSLLILFRWIPVENLSSFTGSSFTRSSWFSSVRHEPCPTTSFLFFFFSQTGRRCHFRFRVPANRLASTFFLPVSGDPSEVTEYQHLWVSTLTHILYFDGLLLLIHARGIVVILFLSSHWDTT